MPRRCIDRFNTLKIRIKHCYEQDQRSQSHCIAWLIGIIAVAAKTYSQRLNYQILLNQRVMVYKIIHDPKII